MSSSHSAKKPGLFGRLTRSYVVFSYKYPWWPLILIALTAWGGFHLSTKLRIDTDLRVLLPKGTPSKEAIEEAERRKGSTDFFTIAMEAPDIETVGRFQKAVAESLQKWPEAIWVQYDQDRSFFEKRALLYLPTGELTDLRDRVNGMIGGKFAAANPLIESLDDEAQKPSLEGWPNMDALRKEGLPEDIITALTRKVQHRSVAHESVSTTTDDEGTPVRPDSLQSRLMGWHPAKGVWVGVVLAQLNQPSTNALFAKGIYDKGTALIDSMHPQSYGKGLVAKVAGAYRNFNEINEVTSDMVVAGLISFILMAVLLWFFVRKPVNLLLINMPLFVAMAWAMGATYLVYQRLTMLTAFILSLILGLGIEYAVHLYSRWAEEGREGRSPVDAMSDAMIATGRSLISGAATNIFAMLSLQMGHFKGFKEFGIVICLGISFALLANWIVMPPLFFLVQRLARFLGKHLQIVPGGSKTINWIFPSHDDVHGGILLPALPLSRKVLMGLGIGAGIFTLVIAFGPQVQFENDFRNLRGKSTGAGISYGRAVGGGRNTSPSIILGHSVEQMRSVHDSLAARHGNPADSMMESFVTIQSFVPAPEKQKERLAVLGEIRGLLGARALDHVDSSTRSDLESLKKYLDVQAFDFEDLPGWAQRFLTEADGSHGKLGYLYADMRESDAVESAKFKSRFQYVASEQGPVLVASSGFIYADVVRMVKGDGPILAIATLLLLVVITWLDMRRWRGVLIAVGFIVLSSWWTYKLMGILGLKLGVFNLVVVPTILSVSVDSVIHLYHRRLELGAGKMRELFQTTGSAVLTGTLNNLFGFLGLCFVSHKGMQTIGFLATLGIGCGLVVMFTALPCALEFLCPKNPVHEASD
jgi:predicted RND superfamily exporter protein